MQYGRPPTGSLANRPTTRSGAANSWNRGGVGVAAGAGGPPKTAMPPPTGRPGTGVRGVTGFGGGIQVLDRPMTQQGLGGMKTGIQGPRRMVQDKTFFTGELRQKLNLLTTEISKLQSESDTIEKDNSNYSIFEKRADALTEELLESQGQLGDLNMLVEKLHTDTELDELERQISTSKSKNARDNQILNDVFMQRQSRDNAVKDTEKQIEEERKKAEKLLSDLPVERRSEYLAVQDKNTAYSADIEKRQNEVDEISRRMKDLQYSISEDLMKQKAAALYEKFNELKTKKMELEDEVRLMEKEGGPEERERLLKRVKEDNQEISGMDRKTGELEEHVKRMREQLGAFDMELESSQGEKNAKYEELLRRDKEMQQFIDSFEEKMTDTMRRSSDAEKNIVLLMDEIKLLSKADKANMPTTDQFKELQGDLKFKEKEMRNSESTSEALMQERERRLQDLEKVNQLETKLHNELKSLRVRVKEMEDDTEKISNVEELKRLAEAQKRKNAEDKRFLSHLHFSIKTIVNDRDSSYQTKKNQLQENETHTQLSAMEQKLKQHESSNFHLKDYIAQKGAESDYQAAMGDVIKLIDNCNGQIVKIITLASAR